MCSDEHHVLNSKQCLGLPGRMELMRQAAKSAIADVLAFPSANRSLVVGPQVAKSFELSSILGMLNKKKRTKISPDEALAMISRMNAQASRVSLRSIFLAETATV